MLQSSNDLGPINSQNAFITVIRCVCILHRTFWKQKKKKNITAPCSLLLCVFDCLWVPYVFGVVFCACLVRISVFPVLKIYFINEHRDLFGPCLRMCVLHRLGLGFTSHPKDVAPLWRVTHKSTPALPRPGIYSGPAAWDRSPLTTELLPLFRKWIASTPNESPLVDERIDGKIFCKQASGSNHVKLYSLTIRVRPQNVYYDLLLKP